MDDGRQRAPAVLRRADQAVDLLILIPVLYLMANLLAILLRVSCHFCSIEIPTYGRALFTVAASMGLSAMATIGLQSSLAGSNPLNISLGAQLVLVALDLIAFAAITVGIYMPLLRVRFRQAFYVWLVQAVVFICIGTFLGGCITALSLL